jgi:MoaA/NifB/PqqE/SkfB family radical SAM enzyme
MEQLFPFVTPVSAPRHVVNSRLNEVEIAMGRTFLESMPRYMTIVLGNGCNIDCPHCYQVKNGDNLLRNSEIGMELRREFMGIYPYLETLRIQGGEVFALKGFRELLDDIAATVERPVVSISTNGTLIDEQWARRIVTTPFNTVTISFDAGTKETFEKMRRGASFDVVTENVRRLQRLKLEANSWYPNLDAFFVLMRSNFREIPVFLDLMEELGIFEVAFQTMLTDDRNLSREPWLGEEVICDEAEVRELYEICREVVVRRARAFDRIAWSGLTSLFARFRLDTAFLDEEGSSLYTDCNRFERKNRGGPCATAEPHFELPSISAALAKRIDGQKQCPNPWTTMFITENGDISICFLSEPVGNLYERPLAEIWNCPRAVAKRSRMLAGRYTASGCSKLWCDWRDGKVTDPPDPESWHELLELFQELRRLLATGTTSAELPDVPRNLRAYRRLVLDKERRIKELESNLEQMWNDNGAIHTAGQRHIKHLEEKVRLAGERLASAQKVEETLRRELKVVATKLSESVTREKRALLPQRVAETERALESERLRCAAN